MLILRENAVSCNRLDLKKNVNKYLDLKDFLPSWKVFLKLHLKKFANWYFYTKLKKLAAFIIRILIIMILFHLVKGSKSEWKLVSWNAFTALCPTLSSPPAILASTQPTQTGRIDWKELIL